MRFSAKAQLRAKYRDFTFRYIGWFFLADLLIAIAGVGLATSQIASAVILAQPNDYQQHLRFRAEVFGWSVGIGVFFAVLIFIGLRFRR